MAKFKKPLSETHPEIAAQWSPRNEITPDKVGPGSVKRYWWVGDCGHEWEAPPNSRTNKNSGCPFCSRNGSRVLPGFNDLETKYPNISKEWDISKNPLKPSQVMPKSEKKAWWIGSCGHGWEMAPVSRTSGGQGCPVCAGKKLIPGVNDLASQNSEVASWWHPTKNDKKPWEVFQGSGYKAWWVCEKGHESFTAVCIRNYYGNQCKQCSESGVSRAELELSETVSRWGLKVRQHHRQIDPAYEYDITVPEQRIAVEFNGLYWHSERVKGADYHLRKTFAANKAGWQLIHVWEDDWLYRRPVVEKMLKRKLGVSDEERLNARSLTYRQVTSAEATPFLEDNHIQGTSGGSWRGGLFNGDELVAVMLMKRRSEGQYELTRYATSAIVRGGHSKLLKRFIADLSPKKIITFSDRGVSDGGLYEQFGFVMDGELAPDYMYRIGSRREHKFNYRKARFKSDPNLKYEEGLTERQLAELNGLERIYDAGKVRWVWSSVE